MPPPLILVFDTYYPQQLFREVLTDCYGLFTRNFAYL